MSKTATPKPVEKIRKTKYPIGSMKVGESFIIKGIDGKGKETEFASQEESQKVSRAVWAWNFRNPKAKKQFSVQLFDDGRYRCTRIK